MSGSSHALPYRPGADSRWSITHTSMPYFSHFTMDSRIRRMFFGSVFLPLHA